MVRTGALRNAHVDARSNALKELLYRALMIRPVLSWEKLRLNRCRRGSPLTLRSLFMATPRILVSDKCIGFTEALLQYRRPVLTDQEALEIGQELFSWFDNNGALTEDKAPIATRSVDLGVTLLKTSVDTAERIVDQIRDSYLHYAAF